MQKAVIEMKGVSKRYGPKEVLRAVSFSVHEGSLCALIGENGAGKSTLIKLINGLTAPSSGTVALLGQTDKRKVQKIRRKIGYMPDLNSSYGYLSARDNLVERCLEWDIPLDESLDKILSIVGLHDTGKKRVKAFSMGMKRRLDLGIALLGDPEFLILDEPTNGLDPMGIAEVRRLLMRLNREQGKTILISSHNLDEVHRMATDYLFLRNGELVRSMTSAEILKECREVITMRVSNPAIAASVIGQAVSMVHLEDGSVQMSFEGPGREISDVVQLLTAAGVKVFEAYSTRRGLEDFYLELIGKGGGR